MNEFISSYICTCNYVTSLNNDATTSSCYDHIKCSWIFHSYMEFGAGVLVLGRGHISHVAKMHYFFLKQFPTPRHRSDKPSTCM